ncbi:hypothetical protein FS749_008753 [Ceratobasidium sp. UAMH 11750]|nr:hypothetical protein FS749_008753 [Ceratobasidium sp. UAMH 11750]
MISTKIVPTHEFNPLCAFEHGSRQPIIPAEYGLKLRGAIVEAHFTLSHRFIMRRDVGKTSHFTATVDELVILGMPAETPLAPSMERNRALFTIGGTTEEDEDQNTSGSSASTSAPAAKRSRK